MKSSKLGPLHLRGGTYYCFLPSPIGFGRGPERSLKTKDLAEAKLRHKALMAQHEAGELPNSRAGLSLEEACACYLRDREIRLRPGSFKSEQSIVKRLLASFPPAVALRHIAHLERVRGYELSRTQAGASRKTINNEVQVLRRILQDANLWTGELRRLHEPLPVLASDLPSELSDEQALALHLSSSPVSGDELMVFVALLAYHTGMRAGEIRRLRLSNVVLGSSPFIRVSREATKTDHGVRWVPLDRTAVWCVQKLIQRADMLGSCMPEHYLLPKLMSIGERNSRIMKFDPTAPCATWERAWRTLKRRCGIDCRFHDLRHSYISAAARGCRSCSNSGHRGPHGRTHDSVVYARVPERLFRSNAADGVSPAETALGDTLPLRATRERFAYCSACTSKRTQPCGEGAVSFNCESARRLRFVET